MVTLQGRLNIGSYVMYYERMSVKTVSLYQKC